MDCIFGNEKENAGGVNATKSKMRKRRATLSSLDLESFLGDLTNVNNNDAAAIDAVAVLVKPCQQQQHQQPQSHVDESVFDATPAETRFVREFCKVIPNL